jgi:hypothetical protein
LLCIHFPLLVLFSFGKLCGCLLSSFHFISLLV